MKGLTLKLLPAGLLLLVALIPSCIFGFPKILDCRIDYHKYVSYLSREEISGLLRTLPSRTSMARTVPTCSA